jgi:hypothetical protein
MNLNPEKSFISMNGPKLTAPREGKGLLFFAAIQTFRVTSRRVLRITSVNSQK